MRNILNVAQYKEIPHNGQKAFSIIFFNKKTIDINFMIDISLKMINHESKHKLILFLQKVLQLALYDKRKL